MSTLSCHCESPPVSETDGSPEADVANVALPHPPIDEQIDNLKRAFAPLERELVGFGPVLTQALYALLTGENMLVFSPPGTAKTLFARSLFHRISGARVFDTQLSKGTLAEELFGSVDIERMKAGQVVHNTSGTLVDADLAFIDEFFDANDMVLRALLGIFHERVFKKGTQTEQARLHTGIAAANYVRATGVTEAVLDRFLFRATIVPDYHPFTLMGIDRAFARHRGEPAAASHREWPACDCGEPCDDVTPKASGEQRLPLARLAYLKAVVTGRVEEHPIAAPPHVLLMKNILINRYRELLGQAREQSHTDSSPPYISPRTYAKSRLVLNAAALLRGRREVCRDDLSQLKYVVTTIGGEEDEAQCFDEALRWTLMRIRDAECKNIDRLMAAHELIEQILTRLRTGERIPCTRFLQRLLRLFGLISEGDVTFHHVRRFIEQVSPRDNEVKRLKQGLLGRLRELSRRIDFEDDPRAAAGIGAAARRAPS